MSRPMRVLLAALGGTVVVAVLVAVFAFRDTTTPLDPDAARRAAAATTTTRAPAIAPTSTTTTLAPGTDLYAYDTFGREEIDALGGARHDYPADTYLTVGPGGCGTIYRWQAIAERYTSWEVCDPERLGLAGFDSFNQWFGVDELQQYRCEAGASLLPPEPDTRAWTFSCTTGTRTEDARAELLGEPVLEIGGQATETLHVRYTIAISGDSTGDRVIERWFRTTDLLPVKELSTTMTANESAIGVVNYTEKYEVVLRSAAPVG